MTEARGPQEHRGVRAFAWFAIAVQPLFVCGWIVAGALEPGYSHLSEYVSELAARDAANPLIPSVAIALLGLSAMAVAPGLLRVLPRRPASSAAAGLFIAFGLLLLLAAVLPLDCSASVDGEC